MPEEDKDKGQRLNWPIFILGVVFLLAAFAFAFYGFQQQILTCDQRKILLKWALPIATAIASGCFTGSISVNGNLEKGLKVGAIGGFAVWLISFLLLTPQCSDPNPKPNTLRVSQFNFLVESSVESDGINTVLSKLERRSSRDYKIKSPANLRIAFGLVIEGFTIKDGRSTKIRINASVTDENGKELASSPVETFDTITEWRDVPTAKKIGAENVIDAFSLSKSAVNSGQAMPTIILLENFAEKEIPNRSGFVRIQVKDELSNQTVTYEEEIKILRTNLA
jgi:hypothetical protein